MVVSHYSLLEVAGLNVEVRREEVYRSQLIRNQDYYDREFARLLPTPLLDSILCL